MSLAVRSHKQIVDSKPPMPGLRVVRETNPEFMAALQGRTLDEMAGRFADGHHAYVGWLGDEPAAWGWMATRRAEIGELNASFSLPDGHRYLWNFVTLPLHRGKGLYTHLLNEIVRMQSTDAEIFWIAYAPENRASERGIHKAGFRTIATLSFDENANAAVAGLSEADGALAAELLGLTQTDARLSQCWRCARAHADDPSCRTTTCCCDYQRPQLACTSQS